MIKITHVAILCGLLLALAGCASTQQGSRSSSPAILSGWNGIKWGSSVQQVKQALPSAIAAGDSGLYNDNEIEPFSGIQISRSLYFFNDRGQLYQITATVRKNSKDGEAIARGITKHLGVTPQNLFGMNTWRKQSLVIFTTPKKELFNVSNETYK